MYVIKRPVECSKPRAYRYATFLCSLDYLTRPKNLVGQLTTKNHSKALELIIVQ